MSKKIRVRYKRKKKQKHKSVIQQDRDNQKDLIQKQKETLDKPSIPSYTV